MFFIVFVKFFGWIVAMWVRLARFIEEKGGLQFWKGGPITKMKYIMVKKKNWTQEGSKMITQKKSINWTQEGSKILQSDYSKFYYNFNTRKKLFTVNYISIIKK